MNRILQGLQFSGKEEDIGLWKERFEGLSFRKKVVIELSGNNSTQTRDSIFLIFRDDSDTTSLMKTVG